MASRHAPRSRTPWARSPERAELLALYAEADSLLDAWSCVCTAAPAPGAVAETPCCHFAVTGREPYPTAVELEEVRHAIRTLGATPRDPRKLPLALAGVRPCPLLSDSGRCRIYASRPLGCRTYFCRGAEAAFGGRAKVPRDAVNAVGRRIADLSSRFAPHDPHPRLLTRALDPR